MSLLSSSRGGWARSANFVPHQHFSDSARVLQHGLNTVNLHRYHLSSVVEVSINIIASIKLASLPFRWIQ